MTSLPLDHSSYPSYIITYFSYERILCVSIVILGFFVLYIILRTTLSNSENEVTASQNNKITDFKIDDKPLPKIISKYSDEESLFLDHIEFKDGSLRITLSLSEDKKVETDVFYRVVSKEEINSKFEKKDFVNTPVNLSKREINFLIDEYKNIYLLEKLDGESKIYLITETKNHYIEYAKDWLESNKKIPKSHLNLVNRSSVDSRFNFVFQDKVKKLTHKIKIDSNYEVQEYQSGTDINMKISEVSQNELKKLFYSHGLEIELQLVNEDWSLVEGGKVEEVYDELLENAIDKLENIRKEAPEYIKNKWSGHINKKMDNRGCYALHVQYFLEGERKYYSIFGKDSHVSLKTNILEIQTPPCKYLDEIEWWAFNLYKIANEVIAEVNKKINILPLGSNPIDDYSKGITFGEHHHIYIPDEKLRTFVYNSLRSFIPYFIAISSNSPFSDDKIPEFTFNDKSNLVILGSSYCNRLDINKEQFSVPPFLPFDKNITYFDNKLKRTNESSRMVDIYPFTRFNTIEIRVFDTQLTSLSRITDVVILQSLVRYIEGRFNDTKLKNNYNRKIKRNRKESIKNGFYGRFYLDKNMEYILDMKESSELNHLYELNRKFIQSLWPSLIEMDIIDSRYVKLMFLRLLDITNDDLKPPLSDSQLLIYLSHVNDISFEETMEKLLDISKKSISDVGYHPSLELLDIDQDRFSKLKKEFSNNI